MYGVVATELRGFGCAARADVNAFSGPFGSSAKGSNLMKGGGFLERIEEDLRRPPAPEGEGLTKEAGLLLPKVVVVVVAAMMGLAGSEV